MSNTTGTPKFQTILAAQGQEVLDSRAAMVLKRAKAAMTKKLSDLDEKRDCIETEILNLTDLSVETKDSLRPGDKNFNAKEWVDKLCSLKMDLALLEDEIAIAEEVAAEYFEVATAETAE